MIRDYDNFLRLFLTPFSADSFLARKSLDPNCIVCVNSNDGDIPLNCGIVGRLHMNPSWLYDIKMKKVIMTSIVTGTDSIFTTGKTSRIVGKNKNPINIDFSKWNTYKMLGFNTARGSDYWDGYKGFGLAKIRQWDVKNILCVRDSLIAVRDMFPKVSNEDLIKHRIVMIVFLHQLVPVKDQHGSCEPLHPFVVAETTPSLQSLEPSELLHSTDSSMVSSEDFLEMGDVDFLLKYAPDVHEELTRTTFNEGLPGAAVRYDHDHCRFPEACGAYVPVRLPLNSEKAWLRSSQLSGNIPFLYLDTVLDYLGEDGTSHNILADCMRRGIDRKDSALMHNSLELLIPKPVDGRFTIFVRALANQSQGKRVFVA